MEASIQLIIVTAGSSFINFFKASLGEPGTKKDKKMKYVCLNLTQSVMNITTAGLL